MALLEEFKEFGKGIFSWFCLFFGFTLFFFLFSLKEIEFLGRNFLLPLPGFPSFSAQFFSKINADFLPSGVELIVTNPLSAFSAQIMISLLLAFVLTLPFFLYKIIGYLSPSLFEKEKKAALKILFPSLILFFSGFLFAYFFLIPATFKTLYQFASAIGATSFFSVNEFVSWVFAIMMAVGIMFLLPILMILLTGLGLVEKSFWKKNWLHFFLVILVISAIITPDGSGITMLVLSLPLILLYFFGYVIISLKRS